MLGTHVAAAMETLWKAAQSDSLQLKIALFNTDEMRFEWKKMSEILNGLEIKLARLLFTEMALAPAMRRGQEKET